MPDLAQVRRPVVSFAATALAANYLESHLEFMRTKDIAQALAGRLDGDGAMEIDRLVHPARAERPSDLALAISADA